MKENNKELLKKILFELTLIKHKFNYQEESEENIFYHNLEFN